MIRKIRKSLMLKWTLFSILLATIPLSIAGIRIIQIYQRDLKKSLIELEGMKADIVAGKTEAFFERLTSDLYFIARNETLRAGKVQQTRGFLEDFLFKNENLVELTLFNGKGREVIKVSKTKVFDHLDLREESKSELFGRASRGGIYYGDFYLTPDMVPTMVVAIPIEDHRGKIQGVLGARIHLRYLWNVLPQTQIGKKGSTYVVDREGNLIAHPDTRKVLLGLNVRHLPMVDQAVRGKDGNLEFEYPKGETHLGVYKAVRELGWGIIVQVPTEEAYGPVDQVAHTALKWILIAFGVAVFLGLFLTRRLTLPVKHLSEKMDEVAKGNLNLSLEPRSEDEIGHLTRSFNQMIQDLRQSQQSLREAEEKYRRIFENSKDMIFITTPEGSFLDINPTGVQTLGYKDRETLLQSSVLDTYDRSEDRQRFREEISKEGFVKDFEVKLRKKDGTPIDCLITASRRSDEEGHLLDYEGIVKDITVRKRMEEELRQKTQELQGLYELSSLINQSLDLNEVLTNALNKILDLTGFEMGGIYLLQEDGKTLAFKYCQGYSPAFVDQMREIPLGEGVSGRAIQTGRPVLFRTEDDPASRLLPFLKQEGIEYTMSIPLLVKEKVVGAINLSTRSVHVSSWSKIDLLESFGNQIGLALENANLFSTVSKAKSEWETTFDAVTDLITIRDQDYRILRANKAALKRFGLDPREMIGRKCYEALHHQTGPCEGCYVAQTLKTRKPAAGERESLYLHGIFQYHTFPVFNQLQEVVAVVDLAREITEEKRLEREKEVLNTIHQILASSLDVRQVMKAVHSELKKVLHSDRMTVTLMDEAQERFRFFAIERDYHAEEWVEEGSYPYRGTPFEETMRTGFPIVVSDTMENDSWLDGRLLQEGIRSSLIYPLQYEQRTIGTLNFGSKEPHHFSERQFDFLRQIASGLAISIENSLLLDEIRQSEEKYRQVVEAAHDGVLVVGNDFQFKYVNETFAEIIGYPREELIGMDFRNVLEEESKALVADRYLRRQKRERVSPPGMNSICSGKTETSEMWR